MIGFNEHIIANALMEFSIAAGMTEEPTVFRRDGLTHFSWGSTDPTLGKVAIDATELWSNRLEVLNGASHWLLEEAPEQCAAMCLHHLRTSRNDLAVD
jgi:pimeloyl-ACP methyl ester carboxylesterase